MASHFGKVGCPEHSCDAAWARPGIVALAMFGVLLRLECRNAVGAIPRRHAVSSAATDVATGPARCPMFREEDRCS